MARRSIAADPAPQSTDEGTLDATTVANTLREQIPYIQRCYERELLRQPRLRGRLDVAFYIGTSGLIERISTRGFEGVPSFTACVVQLFVVLRFPAPTGGGVDFSFPFSFAPSR